MTQAHELADKLCYGSLLTTEERLQISALLRKPAPASDDAIITEAERLAIHNHKNGQSFAHYRDTVNKHIIRLAREGIPPAVEPDDPLVERFRALPLHGDAGCDKLTDDEWNTVAIAAREALKREHHADVVAERQQGQREGFASAVAWLRDRSAMKPKACLWEEAEFLANRMEQSRIAHCDVPQLLGDRS